MESASTGPDHITDYERAICYYTLPRVTSPMTFGLIVAYLVCLMEAAGLLAYGYFREKENFTQWGLIAFGGMVVFGMLAFFVRSLLNQVHARAALVAAEGVPDAAENTPGMPDPFASHLLLRRPGHRGGHEIEITDNAGNARYRVEVGPHEDWWKIHDVEASRDLEVAVESRGLSFSFDSGSASRLVVRCGDEVVARLRRRLSFRETGVEIVPESSEETRILARGRNFYRDDKLVGRMFYLRSYSYLDIERDSFSDGILSYFIAMA